MTTVRLAQLNRDATELRAQKERSETADRPISKCYSAGIFVTGEARGFAREGAYFST